MNETDLGYITSRNQKLNHLLFAEDLKLYTKSERELDLFIQTLRFFSEEVGVVFGLDKCAVLTLKRGNMVLTEGIEVPDGNRMREANLNGYKYLGVLQFDSIMNREMKEKVKNEHIRRVKKLLRSQLNGGNDIAGMNAWAVGIIRYEAGVLYRTKEELKSIEIKTIKLMNMNGSLHPRGNDGRLYLARTEGERGLISCEECGNVEVQSLNKYLSESEEWMLKFVAGENGLSEVEDPDAFKKRLKKEKTSQWLEKPLHSRFLKDTEKVNTEKTLKGVHLKKETEAMVCAAQEQTLRLNSIKHPTEDQDLSPMCRLCGELSETVMRLSSGCPV